MEIRRLGRSGLRVPALAFGTATFGGGNEFFKAWGSTDAQAATRLVDLCLDHGVSLFDSADVYSDGLAEQILGEAIRGRRNRLLISTKVTFPLGDGPNDFGSSRQHLVAAVEASLRRLGPDDPNLAAAAHGLGNIAIRQRRFADAVPLLEQSLSIRERAGVDPVTLATARESLAQALDGAGGDRTRARALMDTARRDYAGSADPELQARATRADAWLAAHPP